MPEAQVLGFECRLFFNDVDANPAGSGTIGTPVWSHIDLVQDATLNLAFSEANVTNRAAGGVEIMEPSLLQISIDATIEWINGNALCLLLWDKAFARQPLDLMALTGGNDNADAKGVRGDFKIFGMPRKEELAEATTLDLTFKPCRSLRSNYVQKASGTS